MRSLVQRWHLVCLAVQVFRRSRPLGVGMRNECWGAEAGRIARAADSTVREHYGISFREFKSCIKGNKGFSELVRNRSMAAWTLRLAFA